MESLFTVVCLLTHVLHSSAQSKNTIPVDFDTKQINCQAFQKGFHVNVRCQLVAFENPDWDDCVLKLRLSRAFYVDPYELSSRQPGMNFTLSKAKPRDNQSSVLGRWLSWLSRGDTSADEIIPDAIEVPMNRSEVDVEAPSWMADAMTVILHLGNRGRNDNQSYPITFQIPVHIRYRLPRDDGISIDRTQLAHPSVKCDDGFEYNKWNTVPPFELPTPVPPISDLLFVMPLTILLLVVGLIVLLMA